MMLNRHFQEVKTQEKPAPPPKKYTGKRYVVYFGSREIYGDMVTAVNSLIRHTQVDKVFLLTEDDEYPYEMPECVENINARNAILRYNGSSNPNYSQQWTYMGLARTTLTKIFPDVDLILSIDCDTIVCQDIGDLWDLDMAGYDYAGAKEPILTACTHGLYINAGVVMCNLKNLRESGREDRMREELSRRRVTFVSQDVMNAISRGHILEISSEYNASNYTEPTTHPKIVHFAGRKDWRTQPLVQQYK